MKKITESGAWESLGTGGLVVMTVVLNGLVMYKRFWACAIYGPIITIMELESGTALMAKCTND